MSRVRRWLVRLGLAALAAGVVATAAPALAASSLRPLQTAVVDPDVFTGPDAAAALGRAAAAGVSAIKVPLFWNEVAPATRPAGFTPADPSDAGYDWTQLDTELRLIRAHGLVPIVYIAAAPSWALSRIDGFLRPDPGQYAAFALAAVRRYSGETAGLPHVSYWQAWNEPNKVANPRLKATAAVWYRDLVNAFAASVHSEPGNAVIAGGLSPFAISTAVAPLTFMRSLLCVSSGAEPHATCSTPVHFDIWSTDPYTAGGPTHKASGEGDVSIAELPQMKAVLDAGIRAGHVISTQSVRFWVTEFSWDSNPPNPGGVPVALEGRWVAEALYDMWSAGVSLVTWFTLRDEPLATTPYQSGLYFMGSSFARDRPKPALTAFRFPFVAFPGRRLTAVWGRTPGGVPGVVVVEQQRASGWQRVAVLHANPVGIFSAEVKARSRGELRARFPSLKATSLPFALVDPPGSEAVYQPFGETRSHGSALPAVSSARPSSTSAVSQYVEAVPTAGGGFTDGTGSQSPALAGTERTSSVPGSALAAAADAIEHGDRARSIAFASALLIVTLSLGASAIRRRRSGAVQPRSGTLRGRRS